MKLFVLSLFIYKLILLYIYNVVAQGACDVKKASESQGHLHSSENKAQWIQQQIFDKKSKGENMPIQNKVMLITYADSLGKNLKDLQKILAEDLEGAVGGVHLLPFFPSTGDRGFAPQDYRHLRLDGRQSV